MIIIYFFFFKQKQNKKKKQNTHEVNNWHETIGHMHEWFKV